jgi:branched-chain amino acid transport system substrate-binding protein
VVFALVTLTACSGGADFADPANKPASESPDAPPLSISSRGEVSAARLTQTRPTLSKSAGSDAPPTTAAVADDAPDAVQLASAKANSECPSIGLLAPTSSSTAALVEGIRHGIDLALGESLPCPIKLIVADTGIDDVSATNAAQTLANDPSIAAVIGPMLGWEADIVGPILAESDLAAISPTVTGPVVGGLHRAIADDEAVTRAVVNLLGDRFRATRVAVIDDGTDYGRSNAERLTVALTDHVSWRGSMTSGASGPDELATQALATAPQAVFVGGFYGDAARVVVSLRQKGFTGPVVLDDGAYTSAYLEAAGSSANNTFVLCGCAPIEHISDFAALYRKRFGVEPPTFAAEAYDATRAVIATVRAGAHDRAGVADRLGLIAFTGTTKRYTWKPDGMLDTPVVYVIAARGGAFVADGLI